MRHTEGKGQAQASYQVEVVCSSVNGVMLYSDLQMHSSIPWFVVVGEAKLGANV